MIKKTVFANSKALISNYILVYMLMYIPLPNQNNFVISNIFVNKLYFAYIINTK